MLRRRTAALCLAWVFLGWLGQSLLPVALAQPELQAKIEQAIVTGSAFLENSQARTGTWPSENNSHPVGYAALPGLTLIECGMSKTDSAIQRAAAFVRANAAKLDGTYEISLAILFLDRLRDPKDKPLIQRLGLRLVAGQSTTGGWSYKCPILTSQAQQLLLTALQKNPLKKALDGGKRFSLTNVPGEVRSLPLWYDPSDLTMVDPKDKGSEPRGTTDNSNTQFALLALWAARRHDVPVDRSLNLITHRFKTGQSKAGGWSYAYKLGGGDDAPAPTCAGLIGLALGQGFAQDADTRELLTVSGGAARAAAAIGDPALHNIVLATKSVNNVLAAVDAAQQREKDPRIVSGLQALAQHVGQPVGRTNDIPQVSFYFLWSLERVAVLYNLSTIGNKDWYRWGAEMLLANQRPQGFWHVGKDHYPGAAPVIDTCLALLFLKRSNLAADLSNKVRFGKTEVAKAPDTSPPPSPPSPAPAPTPSKPPVASAPEPPKTEPAPPPPPAPTTAQAPPPSPLPAVSTDPEPRKSPWPLILIIVAGGLLVGGVVVFFVARSGGGEKVEPAKPRRKAPSASKGVPKARKRSSG
jgi:hypothetical protein